MNECRIEKLCEGPCAECGQEKKGVRFRLGAAGESALLCWEHFRLLQASLRPHATVREIVVRTTGGILCCRYRCCGCGEPHRYRHGETVWRNDTETVCISESVTEGRSCGTSRVRGEGYSEASGHTKTRTGSGGQSHE